MTFTFSIPTLSSIRDMFLLIIVYYGALVEPQYDWFVFGLSYYLGVCIALRTPYRMWCNDKWAKKYSDGEWREPSKAYWFFMCLAPSFIWPLIPIMGISLFMISFGNKKG